MTHDELVRKMVREFHANCTANYSHGNPVDSMSAALRVCVEELLGDMRPTSGEWALIGQWISERSIYMASWADVNLLLKNRRARYSPPKPKTPEERVEVVPTNNGHWCASLDGLKINDADVVFLHRENAERYRLGLIAELKQKEQSK